MGLMAEKSEGTEKGTDAITSVGIQVSARNRLNDFCAQNQNANLKDVLSLVVNWFTDQPDIVKDAVMGRVRPEVASAYAIALRKLADYVEETAAPTTRDLAAKSVQKRISKS